MAGNDCRTKEVAVPELIAAQLNKHHREPTMSGPNYTTRRDVTDPLARDAHGGGPGREVTVA